MTIARRAFFGVLTAGISDLAAGRPQTDPHRIGLETYCFHDVDLDTTLAHVRSLGLRDVELHDGHLPRDASPDRISRARKALTSAGITAAGVYIHDAFTGEEAVARPIFEFAKTMGFRYINGGPKRESLPLLNRLVSEYGVHIAIHNHGPGARYETIEDVTSALDAHPNLRACIDIGHFARSRVDPVRAVRVLGARADAIHVKDVDSKGQNVVVGEGTIDMPGVIGALRDSGFGGLVALEYEGDFDNMDKRLAGMRTSLANMHRLIDAAGRPRKE
jgi:sugar phosphate isomerase/epimerase